MFPFEIFPLIAVYLPPGSRSLLNLARSCRSLYNGLLPLLYSSFSIRKVYNILENAGGVKRTFFSRIAVPRGFRWVKRLDMTLSADAEERNLLAILEGCDNMVEFVCSWELFHVLLTRGTPKVWLEAVDLHAARYQQVTLPTGWKNVPYLRRLKFRGGPNTAIIEWLGKTLPAQARIHADFSEDESRGRWNQLSMPVSFVSKLGGWVFNEYEHLQQLIQVFPSFKPESLAFAGDDGEPITLQLWNLVTSSPSITHLELKWIQTNFLITAPIPPTLTSLTIRELQSTLPQSDLPKLREWLASIRPRIKLSFAFIRNRDYEEWIDHPELLAAYLAETKIWLSQPGFECSCRILGPNELKEGDIDWGVEECVCTVEGCLREVERTRVRGY